MEPALDHEAFEYNEAEVVRDGDRAFVLIRVRNGPAGLAGVDRASGRVLFLVSVKLGHGSSLEVARGRPIIRTVLDHRWLTTIHDVTTGEVVYRDSRATP